MKETLEEAVEQLLINDYKKIVGEELNKYELKLIKWLAASSKKYSEEDMIEFALFLEIHLPMKPRKTHRQLLEQFKKK
jgi:antirestriction protein